MYNLTRQDAADKLNISTRSIDRYIKSGKLRSKKDGKVVYVNTDDIENLAGSGEYQQEVIVEKKVNNYSNASFDNKDEVKTVSLPDDNVTGTLQTIYKDLKEEIQKKDQLIQNLAMRVGQAEEVAKNSVSLIDFKKSQYLLEESKEHLDKELSQLEKDKEILAKELKYEKTSNILLIIFVVILLAIAGTIWFMKI
ncbi:MAG: hypothetical protein Q8K30_02330 [Candidatus Gracilibacteria bacterium]|nr:hypothetical protein [Candidatus Gracilibacteria bacterium]